ncbi:TrmB family transcriptional regulator [Candidatus Pacearchaeota archaeon]|nr:TrmB family transcriptional regulator [Candidatus Pacearchaeota archaeon]
MDTAILEDLGLTQAEIKVYLALLQLGSSSAGKILEKSSLQNSVVHRALNSLIEKGLISFILKGKKKIYQATNPEHFYEFIEDKKINFEKILPELKEKQKQAKEKEQAAVYKGKKGINEIYNLLLNSRGKEYNTFGGGKRVTYDVMGEDWWYSLHTKRIAKKIKSRQVFDETIRKFGKQLNKRPLSKVKFLSQEFEQLTETIICGNFVAIVMFTENPYGLLIEDKTVAESYRKYFEQLWKIAKR